MLPCCGLDLDQVIFCLHVSLATVHCSSKSFSWIKYTPDPTPTTVPMEHLTAVFVQLLPRIYFILCTQKFHFSQLGFLFYAWVEDFSFAVQCYFIMYKHFPFNSFPLSRTDSWYVCVSLLFQEEACLTGALGWL